MKGLRLAHNRRPREGANQHIDRVDRNAHQSADERTIDADILQVVADGIFQPVGDRLGIPAANRIGNELQRRLAIAIDHADDCAARVAVERTLDVHILAQHRAELRNQLADPPREHRVGIACSLEQRGAALFP